MKVKQLIFGICLAVAGAAGALLVAPQSAFADYTCPADTLRAGEPVKNLAECTIEQAQTTTDLMTRIVTILNVVLGLLAAVTVAVIIIGAVNFITSQGDTAKTTKARNTILYGVIGLVIALLAFAIVNFVLSNVFGS